MFSIKKLTGGRNGDISIIPLTRKYRLSGEVKFIVEEPMTEEPGVEQESPDDSIPKESSGEQGVAITPEGDGDQNGSSEEGSSGGDDCLEASY